MVIENTPSLFLGIDGGGSKCRALLCDAKGQPLSKSLAGPANANQDLKGACQALTLCAEAALDAAGLSLSYLKYLHVGAGLAGMNVPATVAAMKNWSHPFAGLYLTTDLHIASLGAHNGEDGAVIITGTGSAGFSKSGSQRLMLGGYGLQLGDQGGGAWLGLEAVKASLLASDGIGPDTALTDAFEEVLGRGGSLAIMDNFIGQTSATFAKYAPMVFSLADQGDRVALALVSQGAQYLQAMATKLTAIGPVKLAMIGGLAAKWQPRLSADIREKLVDSVSSPEQGAIYFARQQAKV
ncbi:glucosamine kinase nucleotide-binding domain-containing protein [Gallaecimonas mangrovi]|uniref:BadF/BadG/BcrA/BcrD ATPase family protein n=1 Tax=Gallaecimonas mangrovi TaxID=2291597 RepID=UPI000E20736F|nr:BadF/BadG/BcrA/BcrD ATPase family protein [Gallaecimonas mangrovi]